MCKTDYGGGGGGNVPKIDNVICERPLCTTNSYVQLIFVNLILTQNVGFENWCYHTNRYI